VDLTATGAFEFCPAAVSIGMAVTGLEIVTDDMLAPPILQSVQDSITPELNFVNFLVLVRGKHLLMVQVVLHVVMPLLDSLPE